MSDKKKIRLAILDMYDNLPNEGMRNLKNFAERISEEVDWEVFDVRYKNEIPDLNFDIYISSGGPGSPYDGKDKAWELKYFELFDKIWAHNQNGNRRKKYVFAICHSFQLLSRHFQLGNVCERKSTAFGVFPQYKTENAKQDKFFKNLPEPFFAVDSRDWQLIDPDFEQFQKLGASVLSIEKKRENVPYPRAVMAIKLSNEIYMTQFHPEADAQGMLRYFARPDKRELVLHKHGELKLQEMITCLSDPEKIPLTRHALVPSFLRSTINALNMN